MNVAQLILEYFKALAYPIVFLIVLLVLRPQIKALLTGISRLLEGKIVAKYGNASIEIRSATEAIDQSTILDYIKKKDGTLHIEELYQQSKKRLDLMQFEKERHRINAAIEGLAQHGVLIKDAEGNLKLN